jgi:hypothetical protein
MSDESIPAAAVEAAAAEAAAPAEAPPEPDTFEEEIPEGDSFPREYVEKTRAEAAKWRTQFREIDGAFEGYAPEEKTRFLELATKLVTEPEKALEEFEGVTERLRERFRKDTPVSAEEEAAAPEPTPATSEALGRGLTPDDITRLVEERFAAEKEQVTRQTEVDRTFAEAEALDPAYKDPAAKAHLFAIAQHNNTDLNGAHEIIAGQLQETIDAAVSAHMEGLRTGTVHPKRITTGDPANGEAKGPPKTLAEAKAAAEERFRAAYGS